MGLSYNEIRHSLKTSISLRNDNIRKLVNNCAQALQVLLILYGLRMILSIVVSYSSWNMNSGFYLLYALGNYWWKKTGLNWMQNAETINVSTALFLVFGILNLPQFWWNDATLFTVWETNNSLNSYVGLLHLEFYWASHSKCNYKCTQFPSL